jgi:3-dehydroquinate dehydratase
VREGARLVEWRIDRLATADGGVEAAAALLAASPAPAIATCRGAAEGGVFDGDETQRAALYEAVIGAATPPRFVDVELSAWRASPQLRQRITAALGRCRR